MWRKNLPNVAILALLAVFSAGCNRPSAKAPASPAPTADSAAVQGEMTVFVPCGVAGPFGQIKTLFEAAHPGVKIKPMLANIDVQTKALANGEAAPDAWIALGDREMKAVSEAGKVEGEPVVFAYNSIAFLVKKGNPLQIASIADLTKPSVKTIAVATPSNSSGYYCEQALKKAGIWDKLQGKLWRTAEPAMIKTQLAAGKADVGVVYYPCTRETRIMNGKQEEIPGKLQLLGKIPTELSGPIPAMACVVKGAPNAAAGQALVQFLLTDQAQEIWENWAWDRAKEPASGARTTLYLYCGAGLRPMMDPAVEAFKKQKPKVRIDVGYAGSGCLLSQLTFSRRGDLYMPGEDFYLTQASEKGYISGQKPIGYFEPVLLVQKGNPKGIKSLQDLSKPGLKVAVGEAQACAVGHATDLMLKQAKMLDKIKRNIVLEAGNVPELGNAVKLQSVDVSIVWNITGAQYPDDCDVVAVDKAYYKPSLAPIGLLKFSKHPQEAQAFVDFLAGAEGQRIVRESGMGAM
jgi:molybdate transport system substrate-binding protein